MTYFRNFSSQFAAAMLVFSSAIVVCSPVFAQSATAAQSEVIIDSKIMIERVEPAANGGELIKLYTPNDVKVVPGDRLLFINNYHNRGAGAATGFVINNPMHAAVTFTSTDEDWALLSVDGGKTFGKLTNLTVTEAATTANAAPATRPAQPADVTNIRWVFAKPIAPGETGETRFRGIVK